MLTDPERIAAAQAAWTFRQPNRFPSEVICDLRGHRARTAEGTETPESFTAWQDIAAAQSLSPTAYMGLLMKQPHEVARQLLRGLSATPESLGWTRDGTD